MSDIFLSNSDIKNTIYGDLAVITSYDEITQSAVNNILTIFGENQFHADIGNRCHKRRLKFSNSSIEIIKQDCINAIMADDRIVSVEKIDVYYVDNNENTIDVEFVIKTTDDTLMSSAIVITL